MIPDQGQQLKLPGSVTFASAITFVSGAFFGVLGAFMIGMMALTLRVNYDFYNSGSYLASRSGLNVPGTTTKLTLIAMVMIGLGIALACGGILAVKGQSSNFAVVTHVGALVMIRPLVIYSHPLLLVLMLLPVAAILGLLSSSSKAFFVSRRQTF